MIFLLCNNYYNYSLATYPILPMVITFLTFQQNSLSNIRKQSWFVICYLVNYKFPGSIEQNVARIRVQTILSFRVRSCHVSWVAWTSQCYHCFRKLFLPRALARNKFRSFSSFPFFILKPCALPFLYRRHTEVWGKQKVTQKHEHI